MWDLTRPTADPVVLEGHTESVWSLAALPDGRLAVANGGSSIDLWETGETDGPVSIADGGTAEEELSVAVSADGRVISGSCTGEVRVRPAPPR